VRSERVYEATEQETRAKLSECDELENEIRKLTERKAQLKEELDRLSLPPPGELSTERLIEVARSDLRDARAEFDRQQLELFENRIVELQLRVENQTMELRRDQLRRINQAKQAQNEIRERFLPLQEQYNHAMCQDHEFAETDELERLQASYGEICDQIESIASEGARAERRLLESEMEEIQVIHAEIKKFTSDTQLKTLASRARFEALERQISILKQNGSARDMNEAIAEEAHRREEMNAVMQESLRKLRELDQMLGNDDADLLLDARFRSIQERIAAILEDVDPATLKKREQDLRARLHELRRTRG
jgi:hypothetical protein